jgi:RHS repeat-associated protein
LLTLRDDRSKYTRWEYDTEGRLLVKKDHNQAKTQTNSYNANGWQVKRWSPAKGLTQYDYNKIGSLTNVNYPSSTDIVLQRDALGRVTNQVDAAGTTRYTYDSGGQLESALGYSYNGTPIASEQLGYRYDSGWNLYQRTNNGAVTQFGVDSLNQLNAGPSGTYGYDGNGNWTTDGANRTYQYDDENQLTTATYTATFQTQLTYDARMRLRQRREYNWQNGTWTLANTINYIYDGMRTIETRATTGTATYTRGLDLSGSLEGAGGVGGMLARTVGAAHYYYHADGNGNITKLIDANQASVASYKYDSFGKTLSSSGSEAANNPFRFSSKEYRDNSGFYYFGYRWYDPNHQRWPNRDPLGDVGFLVRANYPFIFMSSPLAEGVEGPNLFRFASNNSINVVDPTGEFGVYVRGGRLLLGAGYGGIALWELKKFQECMDAQWDLNRRARKRLDAETFQKWLCTAGKPDQCWSLLSDAAQNGMNSGFFFAVRTVLIRAGYNPLTNQPW